MNRTLWIAPLLTLLLLVLPAEAQPLRKRPRLGDEETRGQRVLDLLGPQHSVREAWRTTRRYYYDSKLNGVDWDAVLRTYEAKAEGIRDADELHELINEMLGELKTSHLALLDYSVWQRELAQEFRNRPTVRAGLELVKLDGRYFANGIAEGGPAEKAGLLSGDEVVTLNGLPTAKSTLLEDAGHDPGLPGPHGYVLDVGEGEDIAFGVRRARGGDVVERILTPASLSLIQATKTSVRVLQSGEAKVGVIHLWHFIHMEVYRTLRRALKNEFAEADVLILDLRGRGGSSAVVSAILRLFSARRPAWSKPVLCLTDRGTRSAKEIFSFHWKRRQLGPIVGETTRGACIGCTFRQLSDGSVLMLPVQDVKMLTRGVNLEGVGVSPTVAVDSAPLPYRAGKDTILEAGLKQAEALFKDATQPAVPF